MKVEVESLTNASIARLEGEIDLDSSPEVREALLKLVENGGPVVVDLSQVSYMDSSGVASLVEAFQRAREQQSRFNLVAPSEAVARVLQLARLDRVFSIHESLESALG